MIKFNAPKICNLGICDYVTSYDYMQNFTKNRNSATHDEILLLQHRPVFTLGQAASKEHILDIEQIKKHGIKIVKSDRGGQITFHAPGQLIIYFLIDLSRKKIGIKKLVNLTEELVIKYLQQLQIPSYKKCNAPGVYVDEKKIASLGFRVKNGCSYHGIALNVDMDLTPFNFINPCGFKGLNMTQIKEKVPEIHINEVIFDITKLILDNFTC